MRVMGGRAEVIGSKGCSGFFVSSSIIRGFRLFDADMSPASSSSVAFEQPVSASKGPFAGLVICVTGLSKEARKQFKEATERLGGQYSPNLHPQCTHLVVQSFGGRKLEHALKHGTKNGLSVVSLGWFVESVRRKVRLSESLYCVKSAGDVSMHFDDLDRLVGFAGAESSCLPVGLRVTKQPVMIDEQQALFYGRESGLIKDKALSGFSFYLDPDISAELRKKITQVASKEGASFVDQWFVGCKATHVVCEETSMQRYISYCRNLVTPLWVLKTASDKHNQRLIHMSADLARHISAMLGNLQNKDVNGLSVPEDVLCCTRNKSHEERQRIVSLAKEGVRNRRSRWMQTCQTPIRPITAGTLLDSICWTVSEPSSTASIYTDSLSVEDGIDNHTSVFFDAKEEGRDLGTSFANFTRPLTESEKHEVIFKEHFLTILFPVDRFSEMGPSSRTFFSDSGFTCLQVLDHIYAFYQGNMSVHEIEVAIHTDSRHADRLRSVYSSEETSERGHVLFKRIDFLGSRRSFEKLKRVIGDNNFNVYELLIRA